MTSKNGKSEFKVATPLNGPLLDIEGVAAALAVTPRHVRRLVSERKIPYLKVGRFVRFDPSELNLWLEKLRVEPERYAPRDYVFRQ